MVLSYLLNVKHNKLYEEYSTFLNSGYFRYKTVDVNQDNTRLYIRVSQLEISLQLKKTGSRQIEPLPEKNWQLPQVGSNGETTTVTLDPGGPQVIGTLAFDLGLKDTLDFSSLIPSTRNSLHLRKNDKIPNKMFAGDRNRC